MNLGYDQKVQVDFSAISNEKITLVHIGEKLIILFDNHSTVTVEPFFDSRHDQLGNLTIEVAPGRDLTVAEFASAFPIINDPSAASAVLPAAGDTLGQNNAQASGANFSPFTVDPLPPVPTNTLAPQEELPTFQVDFPTGFVLQPTTPPAPTISLGTLPELVVDESFLTAATNGIDGSGTGPAGTTVASGLLPVTLNVPGGQQSLAFALSISAPGVDTGLIDSQTGNHVYLFLENGVVVGREGKDAAAAAVGPQDFTVSVDGSGKLTLTDLRSVHEGTGENGDVSEGTHVPAGLISLTATVTDNSNQSSSASADVGPHLTLQDDGPSIQVVLDGEERFIPNLTVDESNLTALTNGIDGSIHNGNNTAIAWFGGIFQAVTGADGVADPQHPISYALSIDASKSTGLVDSQTGENVVLVMNGTTVEGHTASSNLLVFTLSVDSNGFVTFTDDRAVKEPDGTNPDLNEGISIASGAVTLTATITDNDGDTASSSIDLGTRVTFLDDGPTMVASGTGPSLTLDESFLTAGTNGISGTTPDLTHTTTSASFAGVFISNPGADGQSGSISYALSIDATKSTGLVDSQTGEAVVLVMNGTTVEGHTATTNLLVFTLSVDGSGNVTFTEDRAVKESTGTNPDTSEGISLASGAVTLSATITDHDGDTASSSIDLGTRVTFLDDGPTMVASGTGPSLTLDESFLTAGTNGISGTTPDLTHTTTSASFAGVFISNPGADGQSGSISYALSIDASKSTGLVDSQTGEAVVLVMNGTTVEGHTATTNLLVFTLSVDGSGNVTFTEDRAVKESTGTNPDTSEGISLASGAVTLSATITDHDGDTASSSIDLGTRVTFLDDGPTMVASGTGPSLTLDESFLTAGTNGISGTTPDLTHTTTSASFAGVFISNPGADGQSGSISYALSIDATKSTGLVDSQTGEAVVLVMNGTTVEGHTATTNLLVFTLSVDGSGNVTFTEDRAVKESTGTNPDTSEGISLASGAVTLSATITDHDGDTASSSIDLGTRVTFLDDGPTMVASGTGPSLTLDESFLTAGTNGISGTTPDLTHTTTSASFAGVFISNPGADGQSGSISYALSIDASKSTGLVDSQTGEAVVLVMNGTTVEGHTATTNLLVFTLSVDGSGNVTFTEDRAVKESTGTNPDTSEGISLASGAVTLSATITDHDGDTASSSIDLGTRVTFLDDGPTMVASGTGPSLTLDESFLTAGTNGISGTTPDLTHTTTSASFAGVFISNPGADGQSGSISYALSIDASKSTGLVDSQTGEAVVLVMNGTTVEGHTATTNLLVFTLSVDGSGNVTFTEDRAVKESTGTNPDTSEGISLASGAVTLSATITDHDGDTASSSIDLGTRVTFLDDGPTMVASGTGPSLTLDESFLTAGTNGISGTTPDLTHTTTSASFAGVFISNPGADGQSGSISYALSIDASKSTGLVDSQTGEAVVLVMNGTTVEGHTATTNLLVFTLSVDGSGNVTFTEDRAVKESTGTNPDTSEGISLASGAVTLSATITDHDGDTASSSIDLGTRVTFLDDGPTMVASGTGPSLTLDESFLTAGTNGISGTTPDLTHTTTSASFAGVFISNPGADGQSGSISYALSIDATKSTGLVDSQTGEAVVLVMNGTTVEGHTATTNLLVFTLSVDGSGNVTFTEDRAVKESTGTNPDTSEGISLASGAVTLSATITDHDGDTASSSIDLGTRVTFLDDGPTMVASGTGPSLTLDESFLTAGTNGISGTTPDLTHTTTSASFAGVFISNPGADGQSGSISYALSIDASKSTGLVDSQTGEAVVLVMNGTTVEGHTATTNLLVFTLSVDGSGNVTFTEDRAVKESTGTNPDTSEGISLASGAVTLSATITDHDGDTASSSIDLGTRVTFLDDGPTMVASGTGPSLTLDESFLTAGTNGISGTTPDLTHTTTSASFAGVFISNPGADGQSGSISYALSIDATKSTGLVDSQTGEAVVLVMNGTTVEGHTATTNLLVFTLSVDGSGNVTFTEDRAVKESTGTNPDTSEGISLASGAVTLSATITDHDGDTASSSIDLGTRVTFLDDGPTMVASGTGPSLTLDESFLTAGTNGISGTTPDLTHTTTSASFAGVFISNPGADGQSGSISYALSIDASKSTGLVDSQTGEAVVLVMNGTTVEGHTATTNLLVFTLSVDGSGNVTFTEDRAVKESTGTNPDTSEGISLASGAVTLSATITDHDGDTASSSIDLGTRVTFLDDGPTMVASGTGPSLTLDESFLTAGTNGISGTTPDLTHTTTSASFAGVFISNPGADGQSGSISYALSIDASKSTGLVDSQTGEAVVLVMNGTTVEGHTATTNLLVFTLSVDGSGNVTFTEDRAVKESTGTNPDTSEGISLASGAVTLSATITDHDGDTASSSIDLGTRVTFLDDGPTMVASGTGPSLTLDESFLTAGTNGISGTTPDLTHTTTSASFAGVFISNPGADGQSGSISYALSIDATKSTGLVDSQTGEAVVLVMNGTTVEGHTATTNLLVFTLSVDGSGNVTFTEDRAVKESTGTNPDTSEGISLASGAVTLSATITDHDGDTASSSIDLGTRVTFLDDGPTMVASGTGPSLTLDESFLTAGTNGISGTTPDLTHTTTSASFAGVFISNPGADGQSGSISYALSIDASKSTGLVDSQTGEAVVLVMNGTTVEGHTATTNLLVFTLSVDGSGNVTFTEDRAVKESTGTNPDTSEGISLASGAVTLSATITDHDGDTASSSIDLGTRVTFLDDGPTMVASGTGPSLTLDESFLTAGTNGISGTTPDLTHTTTSASFAGVFISNPGADGQSGSISYALSIDASKSTGLVDSQTGEAVVLVMNGTTVEGHTATTNLLVFTLSVDGSGNVTFTEDRAVKESTGTNPDTSEGISLASGAVTLSATITDHDGDTASSSIDLGTRVTFLDDGPTMVASGTGPSLTLDESFLTAGTNGISGTTPDLTHTTTSASFAGVFISNPGADGQSGSISYALSIDASKSTGLVDSQTGEAVVLVMNGTTVEGHTATTNLLVFTLSVDGSGNVTFTEDRAVKESTGTNPDTSEGISLASGAVTLSATITDHDGDTASSSIDLGTRVTFLDDGPIMSGFQTAIVAAQDNQIANGTYNINFGADGDASMAVAVHNGSVGSTGFNLATTNLGGGITSVHVTGNGDDYTFYYTTHAVSGGVELDAFYTDTAGTLSNPFFSLLIDPNGTYTFDLESVGLLTQVTVNGSDFGASGGGQASLTSPDGQLIITGTDNNGNFLEVKASNNGIAVGHSGLQMDANEDLHLNFAQEQTQVSFIFTQWQSNGTADVKFDVKDGATLVNEFDINVAKPGSGDTHIVVQETSNVALINTYAFDSTTQTYTLYVGQSFTEVDVDYNHAVSGGATFTVNSITYNHETLIPSTDLLFDVTATDHDTDTATSSLQVDLVGGSNVASGATLTGTSGNDLLVGGSGNDTLVSGTGNDIFALKASGGGHDILSDFDAARDVIVVDVASLSLTTAESSAISAGQFTTSIATGQNETAASAWNESGSTNKFFFNATTQELWYSANGTGSDKIDLAHLSTGVPAAANIHVA
ncbi:DUF5801 repeats-in-toxin domain-containing protein [Bradyrhizobium sp. CCBAU 53338]|uniref:DUF5801 repeats-in-toxin domain-containing protein n=1 Tax=Bradyrhizobium sp. CCBAU 53338 TaxID=1325111 RepID=UPI00188B49DF|nr:DUF5801 repeats-in-toxin domain-containing protein [Bradyrhizobium sp. CCBAU 53338]